MAKLYITHPLGEKNRVIYDTHATTVDVCLVTFEDDLGGQAEWTGPAVSIDLGDGSAPLEVYQDVLGESALGKYVIDGSSWKLFGPDGPARTLSDAGPTLIDGVEWNPKQFQAVTPGRWLVKTQGRLIVRETESGNGYMVASDDVVTFTALLEIEDPHVLGNVDGGHAETSSASIGTSYTAPTEEVEYDADEGWARSAERYFSTVSKGMSFRKLASGVVTAASGVAYGGLLTVESTEEYKQWRSSLVGIDLAGTEHYYYNYNLQVRPVVAADLADEAALMEMPIFVSLGTAARNGRVYMMVEGCLPFDTSAIATIDPSTSRNTRLFIQVDGTLGPDRPSTVGAYFDRYVGHVLSGNLPDDSTIPGGIYFHGHTTWLPGVLHGPLSTTDDAIVRWDGTTGELVKNSAVKVEHYDDSPPTNITELYTDIAVARLTTVDHATVGSPAGTQLHVSTEASASRTAGSVLVKPGDTGLVGSAASSFLSGGDGVDTSGDVTITGGEASSTAPGVSSGGILISTLAGIGAGDIEITAGNASGSDAGDLPGAVTITSGSAQYNGGAGLTLKAGNTADLGGGGSLGGNTWVIGGDGASGGDVVVDGGEAVGAGLPGNVLINTGVASGTTGIGGDAPDPGFGAMPTAILKVTGDSYFEGDLHISNKLTVDGIIDPIALILSTDSKDMVSALGADSLGAQEGALFVADGTDPGAVDHLGNPLVSGELYYKYGLNFDGVPEKFVSLSTGAGLSIPGPLVGSTFANAIARWSSDAGDSLENSKVLVDSATSHSLGVYFNEIASLSTTTPAGSTKTSGGLAWASTSPLVITTGEAVAGTGTTTGSIEISVGVSDAPTSADIRIKSGETRVGGAPGGLLGLSAGDSGTTNPEFGYAAGLASLTGGINKSGTTPDANDWERRGRGGKAQVRGGDGNDGGAVEITGGSSIDGLAMTYAHGVGGQVSISGGTAGVDVTGTKGAFTAGVTHTAIRGGDVELAAGGTVEAPSTTNETVKGPSGGDIVISGGDAGLGTGAPIDGTLAAPIHTVQEHSSGAWATEADILPKNSGSHLFHGRGGSVVIEGGKGDHTGGSGSVLIQTQHSNEGWTVGPESVAGVDPNAGRGIIGPITIKAADSLSRTGTSTDGGSIYVEAGRAGALTAGKSGELQIKPGEPDWPLSAPIDHDGDVATPDIQLVEAGPDAQKLVGGVVTDDPWPIDFGLVPPALVGPEPGAISLDPQKRGVVLVGTPDFDVSAHLCFGVSVPRMVVDGDLVVTGNIDPEGVELRPQPQNPARAAILAKDGNPDDSVHAERVENVLWVNSSAGNALMLGDTEVSSVGATVNNPGDSVAGSFPVLNSDGSVSAIPTASGGGLSVKSDANGAAVGTEAKGSRYESFNTGSYNQAVHVVEPRDSVQFPNSNDYVVTIPDDTNVFCVDLTSVLTDVAIGMNWPGFDPDGQLSSSQAGSLSRMVIELPPVADSVGRRLVIKDAKGYSNKFSKFPMIVVRASKEGGGAEYIDDYSSQGDVNDPNAPDAALLPEPFGKLTLICNGERWLII